MFDWHMMGFWCCGLVVSDFVFLILIDLMFSYVVTDWVGLTFGCFMVGFRCGFDYVSLEFVFGLYNPEFAEIWYFGVVSALFGFGFVVWCLGFWLIAGFSGFVVLVF